MFASFLLFLSCIPSETAICQVTVTLEFIHETCFMNRQYEQKLVVEATEWDVI